MVSTQRRILIVSLLLLVSTSYVIGAGIHTENLTTSTVEMEGSTPVKFTELSETEQSSFKRHIDQGEIIVKEDMRSIAAHSYISYDGTVYETGVEKSYSVSFIHFLVGLCTFIYGFGGFVKFSEKLDIDYELISMRAFVTFLGVAVFSMYIV